MRTQGKPRPCFPQLSLLKPADDGMRRKGRQNDPGPWGSSDLMEIYSTYFKEGLILVANLAAWYPEVPREERSLAYVIPVHKKALVKSKLRVRRSKPKP